MKSFRARFGALVSFVLSGFGRLRLRGDARLLNNARGVDSYLDQQHVRYTDFPDHAQRLTQRLRRDTERRAEQGGVPLLPLNSAEIDKEAPALRRAAEHWRHTGPVAVLSCVESCMVYRLRKNDAGWSQPVKIPGKGLHYYHYFLHQALGLCYVRVQGWFPFTAHVGLNGRQWLYRQLEQRGVPFERRNNLLLRAADADRAQALRDAQRHQDWPVLLGALVRPVQPLWDDLHEQVRTPDYWTAEQSEWATDFVFHSPAALARWYPRWLRHGIEALACKDVLRFLGTKVPEDGYGNCTGAAKVDLRDRAEGARLKFWYGTHSLKIYDKEGQALRIETTINEPRGFKVYRTKEGDGPGAAKSWQAMRKGVADLPRRSEVRQAANNRLAESLATIAAPSTLGELLQPLGRPVVIAGCRRARALNPLTGADGTLLRALGQGDCLVNGFRNRDLRVTLHGACMDAAERRRQAAAVTRQLALLKAHGLRSTGGAMRCRACAFPPACVRQLCPARILRGGAI